MPLETFNADGIFLTPKRHFLAACAKNMSRDVFLVMIRPPIFGTVQFYAFPKTLCFTMLFSWLETAKSATSLGDIYTPWGLISVHLTA